MGDYYNRTRTPLSIPLSNGKTVVLRPKQYTYVAPDDEASAAMVRAIRKGDVVRSKLPITAPVSEPGLLEQIVEKVVGEVAERVEEISEGSPEENPEEDSENGRARRRRRG